MANGQMLIVMLIGAMLTVSTNGNVFDDIGKSISGGVDSFKNAISGSVCVVQNKDKFDQCTDAMSVWLDKKELENDQVKDFCCSFITYKYCVEVMSKMYCGDGAEQTVTTMLNAVQSGVSLGQCDKYNNFIDCMNPYLFWAMVVGVAIVAILIVGAVFACLKRAMC